MEKMDIDQKYIDQANQLEAEYFDIVYETDNEEKVVGQHRELKEGKSIDEFNQRHADIWRGHEAELIAEGFMKSPVPPEPKRDLAAEIDDIKSRLAQLEKL